MVIPHCPQLFHRDDRISDLWKSVSTNGRAQVTPRSARRVADALDIEAGAKRRLAVRPAGYDRFNNPAPFARNESAAFSLPLVDYFGTLLQQECKPEALAQRETNLLSRSRETASRSPSECCNALPSSFLFSIRPLLAWR